MLIRLESIDMESGVQISPESSVYITLSVTIKTTAENAEKHQMISNLSKDDLAKLIETRL